MASSTINTGLVAVCGALLMHVMPLLTQSPLAGAAWGWTAGSTKCTFSETCTQGRNVASGSSCTVECSDGTTKSIACPAATGSSAYTDPSWWGPCRPGTGACAASSISISTASGCPAASSKDFKLGDASGCDRDDGWEAVKNDWACRAAMDRVDRTATGDQDGDAYNGAENDADWPSGCYFCKNVRSCEDGTWFNKHRTGSYAKGALPYCMKEGFSLETKEVLFVGDSDIDYWKTTSDLVPGSFNVGVGGYTCAKVLKEIKKMLRSFRPSVVVLVCGENDLTPSRKSPRATYRKFRKIVKQIHKFKASVVYLGTKPEPDTKKLHKNYEKYDKYIRKLVTQSAKKNGGITMIDVYKSFETLGNPGTLYASDDLHLSSEGYGYWSTWTDQALKDSTCALWESGECVTRQASSSERRATMVSGSSESAANATTTSQISSASAGLDGVDLFNDTSATSIPSQGIVV